MLPLEMEVTFIWEMLQNLITLIFKTEDELC